MSLRSFRLPAVLALLAAILVPSLALAGGDAKHKRAGYDQFIVRFKDGSAPRGNAISRQHVLDAGTKGQNVHAQRSHRLGLGADVIVLDGKLDFAGAQAFMNKLRRDPSVEYVEIDRMLKPAFVPNDTFYNGNQWHYYEATGGINMPAAWDLATGAGVVVAVLDTGITAHSDLDANIVPGYDFIKKIGTANDGNGRDSDPSDPGDWTAADECNAGDPAEDSSWHGTHVAGTIAAVTNNSKGVAGVAFNAKVMPLRVLGKCGGSSSDISDAIFWAAGGAITGVPNNANPVEVINMSLGGQGGCGATTQGAIDYAVAQGVVVVVAAGNDNADASQYEPANCNNVIVVGATTRAGGRSSFSNFGTTVDVSAPGGGAGSFIASTFNTGTTVPAAEGYAGYQGTSMATPHVAGVAALMQSVNVTSPAAVEAVLKSTARALPIACPEGCGAGIINAVGAVSAVGAGALTIDDVTATEGNAGTKTFTFTVSLSKAQAGPVTFNIATADGSATAGSDYVAASAVGQSIAAGATSKTFSVTVNGDAVVETNETFVVNVTSVTGIAVADGQGTGTIVNDDATPLSNGVAVPNITLATGQVQYYSIDLPAGRTSLVVNTSGGTGDADLYVRFGALPTGALNDCKSEGATTTETCTINAPQAGTYYIMLLGYASSSGVSLTATYTPAGNPTISIADASIAEGNAGTTLLNFTVNLSAPAPAPVTFDISTQPGMATADVDYVSKSLAGQSIATGQSSAQFSVTINGDTAVEGNETFTVDLANVGGAIAGDLQAQGRIINDDAAQLRINDVSMAEGNSGVSTIVFEVVLSEPMPSPVTFDIATSNGTAAAGSDYVARSQSGRYLDAGRTRALFEVAVNGDTAVESNETFNVTVSNVSGAALADGLAVGTLTNDDGASLAAPTSQVVAGAPVVLGFDGEPLDASALDARGKSTCRIAGERRGRLEPALPTCTRAQAAALKASRR